MILFHGAMFFVLFMQFYIKAYIKKGAKAKKESVGSNNNNNNNEDSESIKQQQQKQSAAAIKKQDWTRQDSTHGQKICAEVLDMLSVASVYSVGISCVASFLPIVSHPSKVILVNMFMSVWKMKNVKKQTFYCN